MSLFDYIVILLLFILIIYGIVKVISVQKMEVMRGDSGIIGCKGRCVKTYSEREGKIFVNGEFWDARFTELIKENDKIIVINVIDNVPIVKKVTDSEENII